jgi:hypothetical protein
MPGSTHYEKTDYIPSLESIGYLKTEVLRKAVLKALKI